MNYNIHLAVSIDGFYSESNQRDLILLQSSVGGVESTQQLRQRESTSADMQTAREGDQGILQETGRAEVLEESDDDIVGLQSCSKDNDICNSKYSDSVCSRKDFADDHFNAADLMDMTSQMPSSVKRKEPMEVAAETLHDGVVTRSDTAVTLSKRKEKVLVALQGKKHRCKEKHTCSLQREETSKQPPSQVEEVIKISSQFPVT